MDRKSRWPLLKEDPWPGHVHRLCVGGSLGDCTQTEAPHYYVGGLGMTAWEWWGHRGTASTWHLQWPAQLQLRLSCSLFICGTWPRPMVPDHHFVLINLRAGGRLSSVLQQSVAVQAQVPLTFLCGFKMFFLWLCGFTSGAPVSYPVKRDDQLIFNKNQFQEHTASGQCAVKKRVCGVQLGTLV